MSSGDGGWTADGRPGATAVSQRRWMDGLEAGRGRGLGELVRCLAGCSKKYVG